MNIRTSHTNNRKLTADTEMHIEKLYFSTISLKSRTEDISVQIHDIKVGPVYREIAKLMSRKCNLISRYSENGGPVEHCTYCGLTGAHSRGKHCPEYGTQCNIYEKFNHFPSVCRANVTQEELMDQKSPKYYNPQKKPCIKRKEYVYPSSDKSSGEDKF